MTSQMFVFTVISTYHSFFTKLLQIVLTRLTLAAGIYHTAYAYGLTNFKIAYLATHFKHFTYDFVSRNYRIFRIAPVVAYRVDITMAYTAIGNFNFDVTRLNLAAFNIYLF